MNQLYYGDNLTRMQQMALGSVDLIYLDPPFNSKKNYNLMYKTLTGKPVPEQVDAFCDTWEMDTEKEEIARAMPVLMRDHGVEDYYIEFWRLWIQALRNTQPHLLAYLIYMVQRILYMKTLLKPTGSLYLHCDPTASHYIKVMLDGIFGHQNFRSEIIWKRTSSHSSAKRWGPVHDVILFYSNSEHYTWNKIYQPYDPAYLDNKYTEHDQRGRYMPDNLTAAGTTAGDSCKPWRGFDPEKIGRHWAVPKVVIDLMDCTSTNRMTTQQKLDFLDDQGYIYWPQKRDGGWPRFKRYQGHGLLIQDIISDISPINSQAKERLGYPTQKPISLLDRIIRASSNEGDVIFDPFCGCGTTIYAAQESGRKWIGCDIAILSIRLVTHMLGERYRLTEGKDFDVDGIPVSTEQAQELFKRDPFQFQHWAVERVGGFPMHRKVADRGVDGKIYFETQDGMEDMVLSVKGGTIRPTDIRDLRGVLEREPRSKLAGFISNRLPTKAMINEASEAGCYKYKGISYDRIQLLTIADILEGKKEFHTPSKVGTRAKTGQLTLPV